MKKIMKLYLDNMGRSKQPTNKARNEAAIYIYDIIDPYWGVSAASVAAAIALAGQADTLHVYINSPGGDIFEARAIMAELRRYAGKTVAHIDSLCASAATSIAIACNQVEMSEGAFFMIHNASCLAWGDKSALRETADLLEKIEGSIVADYTGKTGKDDVEIIRMMDEETWFSASEALDHGFIDSITSISQAKNTWNLSAFDKVPEALTEQDSAAADPAIDQQLTQEPVIDPVTPSMTQTNKNRLALLQVL
jgi:ATP-dependent Clp protease, protease subunit